MSVGEYCNREVVVVDKSESVREAMALMRNHHVGDVIVIEKKDDLSIPIGVLTDRDIVVEILAEDVDLDAVSIGDVMSVEMVTVGEQTKIMDAIKLMQTKGVRRLPVVDGRGGLQGIITVDDIIELLAEQMSDLVKLVSKEAKVERQRRH